MQDSFSRGSKEKFVNPYNFVRLPSTPCKRSRRSDNPAPMNYSGVMHCTLTVKTPLFIPAAVDLNNPEYQPGEHAKKKFFSYGDPARTPVIPGSELRGVIRSNYETLTDSCLSGTADNIFAKRSPLPNNHMKPAIMRYEADSGNWVLYDADIINTTKPAPADYPDLAVTHFRLEAAPRVHTRNELDAYDSSGTDSDRKEVVFCGDIPGAKTGYLQQGNKFGNKGGKLHIFVQKENAVPIILDDAAIRGYKTVLDQYGDPTSNKTKGHNRYTADAAFLKRHIDHGVYYRSVDSSSGKIIYLSPAQIGRIGMHTKVYDLLLTQKSNYVPCSEGVRNDELCPACQLFGTIYRSSGKNQMKSAASHVRFSDAKLTKNKGMMGKVTLPALSVPKFSNELMYLHLNSTNAPKHEFNADFEVLENNSPRMFHQGDVCINGRKYYWHQPDFVLPSGEMETKLNSTITPLNVGNEFSFDIFFEHISKEELDTLAFATDFGDDDIHYQKVGYAKPLGFGSSKVSVNSIELKTLSADPGKPLYELRPYTQRERDFHKIPMIDRKAAEELLTITNFYFLKGRTISYPFTQGHAHDKNEKGFEWFVANKEKLISLPQIGNTPDSVEMPAIPAKVKGAHNNNSGRRPDWKASKGKPNSHNRGTNGNSGKQNLVPKKHDNHRGSN